MTPAQWLARADHLDAQATQKAAAGDVRLAARLSFQAERCREVAAEMERGLTGKKGPRSISVNMKADVVPVESESLRRGRARAMRSSRAQELVYKAGMTISGLAGLLGEKRSTVSAWFATGDLARPVPRASADRMDAGLFTGQHDASGQPIMLRIPRAMWAKLGR